MKLSPKFVTHSIKLKLSLSTIIMLAVFCSLAGTLLHRVFQDNLQDSIKERLKIQIYSLLAISEYEEGQLTLPESLPDHRFMTPDSGLVAWITDQHQEPLWSSISYEGMKLSSPKEININQFIWQPRVVLSTGHTVSLLSYGVVFETQTKLHHASVHIAQSTASTDAKSAAFILTLFIGLVVGATLLIGAQTLIIHWGLRPLSQAAVELIAIEAGELQQLQGHYPKELQHLTNNLNALIKHEHQQQQRYKNSLADLAHSLKTPLTLLQSELESEPKQSGLKKRLGAYLQQVDRIVRYQLQKTSLVTAPHHVAKIAVDPIVKQLKSAFNKIYAAKALSLNCTVATNCWFYGAQGDLLEVLGNLLDNACKWAKCRVNLQITKTTASGAGLQIQVEDDGPGIPEAQQIAILQRGVRLSNHKEGQGIGLAVVKDLVQSYQGVLKIDRSPMQGARITVTLERRI